MYNLTLQNLDNDLNIIQLIKNKRNHKIIFENSFLTEETKKQLMHHESNLLNLEDTSQDSEGDSKDVSINFDKIDDIHKY